MDNWRHFIRLNNSTVFSNDSFWHFVSCSLHVNNLSWIYQFYQFFVTNKQTNLREKNSGLVDSGLVVDMWWTHIVGLAEFMGSVGICPHLLLSNALLSHSNQGGRLCPTHRIVSTWFENIPPVTQKTIK